MKKLLFIFGLVLTCCVSFGQTYAAWDSIRVPDGTDTTIYIRTTEHNFSLEFEFDDFDDIDAVLDIGSAPPQTGTANRNTVNTDYFNRFDDDRLPFTLSDTATSYQAFEKSQSNFKFLAIKLTKNSVTAGLYLRYYLTIW